MSTDDTLPHNACVHTQDGYNTNVYHLTFIRQFHHQNYASSVSSSELCYQLHYCRQCYTLEHTMHPDEKSRPIVI